jgi:hypothetical protein
VSPRWILVGCLLFGSVGGGLGVRTAVAECNTPTSGMSPAGGTVPRNPVLYFFQRDGLPDDLKVVTGDGAPVRYERTRLGGGPIIAHRIQVWRDYGEFDVIYADAVTFHYEVEPELAVDHEVVIPAVRFEDSDWSCSFTRAVMIQVVGEAVAYRLEWDEEGGRASAWLPPTMSTMFAHFPGFTPREEYYRWIMDRDATVAPSDGMLQIGHASCFGHTVPDDFTRARHVELVALFTDGSELRLGRGLVGYDRLAAAAPVDLIGTYPARSPREPDGRAAAWIVPATSAGISLATLASFALLVRLRRRPRRHQARM